MYSIKIYGELETKSYSHGSVLALKRWLIMSNSSRGAGSFIDTGKILTSPLQSGPYAKMGVWGLYKL